MSGIVTAVTGVFTSIGTWITSTIPTLTELFYNSSENSLTFLGVLAVCGLAFSVVFLLIGIIQRFLHFGG